MPVAAPLPTAPSSVVSGAAATTMSTRCGAVWTTTLLLLSFVVAVADAVVDN